MEVVATALGNNTDLPAGSRPEFRRVGVRLHAELLHVFHTGLQTEWAGDLTIEIAGVVADDAAGFDTVVADRILLVGTAVKAHVVEGSRSEIDRARRHKI